MNIETVTAATFELVLPLIAAYQRFYAATPDEARNRTHFSQLVGDHSRGIQFVACDASGAALGFATLYSTFSSVRASRVCLLNDLFTVPAARCQGIGRALITHALAYAVTQGYSGIEWQTAPTNHAAQRLYDSTGAIRSTWHTYSLQAT